jgi:cytochrome c-type biogenesis protein CcsB
MSGTMSLAELSRTLYSPVTLLLYASAAFFYLYSLTTTVGRRAEERRRGRRAQLIGLVLACLGVAAHVAHEVTRALAQDRLPLGNMFEFTSAMALVGVLTGLIYLQFVRRRPELNGFVLLAGTLVLASALLVYADPGPLMPILDTWWRALHVTTIAVAAGILTAGFVFNGLHLLRDTGERGVAARQTAAAGGSTVGAAYAGDLDQVADSNPGREDPDEQRPGLQSEHDAAYRRALRESIDPWRLALFTFLGTSTVSWVFLATPTLDTATGVAQFLAVNVGMVVAALVARWFVPFLPPAATLDGLAYRTIALGFLGWTFGVISGAMWAEQSWGRFWGWDPKETAAFLTWIAYAAYLHARATRGTRGRGAAWIGLGAFAVLMFTYYAVNLVFVGLHSYAGL